MSLAKLLELHTLPGDGLPEPEGLRPSPTPTACERRPAWDVVQLARNQERPNTLEYVGFVFDDFQELHGDRLFQRGRRRSSAASRVSATWPSS